MVLIGFDLDDTLIFTHQNYIDAEREFIDFTRSVFLEQSPLEEEILKLQRDFSEKLFVRSGYDGESFAESMRMTFLEIANNLGLSDSNSSYFSDISYKIGKSVFDEGLITKRGLKWGVCDTLTYLFNDMRNESAIVTLGEESIQEKKIKLVGLNRWFPDDSVYCDLRCKDNRIRDMIGNRNPGEVYFVGNSWYSDIIPAMNNGVNAIYIPGGDTRIWGRRPRGDFPVVELENIVELKDRYDEIFSVD